jgi:hypothetical protein
VTKKQRLRVNITLMNINRSKTIVVNELCIITGWSYKDMEDVYDSLPIESKYELTKIFAKKLSPPLGKDGGN